MSSNDDNLLLEFVRRLGAKVETLTGEVRNLRDRMTRAEHRLAALAAQQAVHHAVMMVRLDRLQARLDRIETPHTPTDRPA